MDNNVNIQPSNEQQYPQSAPINPLNKRQLLLFASLGIVLLIVITSIFVLNSPTENTKTPSPTNNNISPTKIAIPTIETESPIITSIKTQAKPQIDQKVDNAPYDISKVKTYEDEWAIVEISNPNTDSAWVAMKRENNVWNIVSGPGTYIDVEELRSLGAPERLLEEINIPL